MKKGEILEAVIEKYDFPNKGSFMTDDRKVTVKGALPGQKVRFVVTKRKSGMAEGRLLEVLEKSEMEDREPSCPYFGLCGGCAYQTMSYENQLALKESIVKKLLDKALHNQKSVCPKEGVAEAGNAVDGEIEPYVWEGILPSPVVNGYRNKMEFTFGDEYKDGPLALGLHKKGSFHDILNVSGCEIIGSDWSKILDYSLDFFGKKNVPFYHRMRHEGILRNLVIRQSRATGEFLINLVTSTQWNKYGIDEKEILAAYSDGLVALSESDGFEGSIAGILYTENDSLGDVVRCDRIECLYGKDYITEEVMGLKFKISPFSFFQTNTKGCEVLYTKAREYIMSMESMAAGKTECGEDGAVKDDEYSVMQNTVDSTVETVDGSKERDGDCAEVDSVEKEADREGDGTGDRAAMGKVVFDLYSGTGTIAQMMSPAAGKVVGIEIVEEAVEAARENAKLNGLDNCEFIAGDVLKAIDLVEDKPDVIILDPPRDGINPKALDKILAFGVKEMVYISCKPTSLARDLEIITERGYRVVKACAVDQFPGTGHVETVVLLSQQKADDYIEVELELDELD